MKFKAEVPKTQGYKMIVALIFRSCLITSVTFPKKISLLCAHIPYDGGKIEIDMIEDNGRT